MFPNRYDEPNAQAARNSAKAALWALRLTVGMKIYADTSVFGGVFDEEFAEPSKEFFAEVESGRFDLVVSAVVHAEIASAP